MPVTDYFSADYASARELFRATATAAGAALYGYEHPDRRGLNDEPLAIDVASLRMEAAERVLILVSGTHGVEGFCGSGCQVGFFSDRLYEALPASTGCLIIHALNPFGFSWLRRVNEDGVDLNRNFVDFSRPLPSSASYAPLHDWLIPRDWQGAARAEADRAMQGFVQQHGLRAFQTALTGGQYTHPTGLFFGGQHPTWSALTLKTILERHVPDTVQRVAVLDLHTGLGPAGYGEPIVVSRSPADTERARQWYGADVKDLSADESVSAQLAGTVADGIASTLGSREITYVALEFGTRHMLEVLNALRADHWMHAHGNTDAALRKSIQRQIRDAFYTESPAWQAAVYGRTADFVYRACRGLA